MSAPVLPAEVASNATDEASGTVVDPLARDAGAAPGRQQRASAASLVRPGDHPGGRRTWRPPVSAVTG